MADWSQLPRELLNLIAEHLVSETDLLRFRSVCTSWRSSFQSKPFPIPAPILPNKGISDSSWGFYFSKRTIFRLGLPYPHSQTSPSDGWLIKLEPDGPQRMQFLNPLSRSIFKPLPTNFPKTLDLLHFRISELGNEYTLQYINYRPFASSIGDAGDVYMEKVAFSSNLSNGIEGFVLLTIHVSGKLALLKFGDKKWTIIDDLPSPYDDVIFYEGEFYAVDTTGRTVVVGVENNLNVNVVADSVFGGDKKILVESCGELFLVDKHLSVGLDDDLGYEEEVEFSEEFDCFTSERTVRFEVFKMDGNLKKWVEVKNLGERMLFLGDNCSFSALASDFTGCKGNCIFFTDPLEDGGLKSRGIGVFDMESGSMEPLANYSGYSELFWPPPAWVSSTSTALEVSFHWLLLSMTGDTGLVGYCT